MGHTKSFSTIHDDDFEFDEAYFRQFYKPLSNLPTPPPSSRSSSATQSPRFTTDDVDCVNSQYLGPAAHLARMLPPGASFITPSMQTVQLILERANLPMDIIALAVNILDSLNSRFARSWRVSFPLHGQGIPASKRHTLPSAMFSAASQATHIDSVPPEVIVLAALVIAEKFVEDMQETTTQWFATNWGGDVWTSEQINYTERAIMENLQYRIMPLWDPVLIKEARHDIEMARREVVEEINNATANAGAENKKQQHHFKSMSSGHAAVGLGLQLTPAQTPNGPLTSPGGQKLGAETREAFASASQLAVPQDYLRLPAVNPR
ncbi:hypothetical protein F4780DRAFT_588792 [Xylariomycetidae sp. FL0641]|nr:hypothetical protein F4780DRAFT_588792 [Xylariomycetidae sp. FL0641]